MSEPRSAQGRGNGTTTAIGRAELRQTTFGGGMDAFFNNLVGKGFWYHEHSTANRHGDTVRLYIDEYRPGRTPEDAEVRATAVYRDGAQGRAYIRATYLYEKLKGKQLRFM